MNATQNHSIKVQHIEVSREGELYTSELNHSGKTIFIIPGSASTAPCPQNPNAHEVYARWSTYRNDDRGGWLLRYVTCFEHRRDAEYLVMLLNQPIPTQPCTSAIIDMAGDPTVGIPLTFMHLTGIPEAMLEPENREETRTRLKKLFGDLMEEECGVQFDDECPECGHVGLHSQGCPKAPHPEDCDQHAEQL